MTISWWQLLLSDGGARRHSCCWFSCSDELQSTVTADGVPTVGSVPTR